MKVFENKVYIERTCGYCNSDLSVTDEDISACDNDSDYYFVCPFCNNKNFIFKLPELNEVNMKIKILIENCRDCKNIFIHTTDTEYYVCALYNQTIYPRYNQEDKVDVPNWCSSNF